MCNALLKNNYFETNITCTYGISPVVRYSLINMNLFSVNQCSGRKHEILVLQKSLVASASHYRLWGKAAEFT